MHWWTLLIIAAALLVTAPLVARAGKRVGRSARGGFMVAGILLGFGEVLDPPSKHLIEAQKGDENPSPENGEPPLD